MGSVVGLGVIFCYFYLSHLVPRWLGYAPGLPWMDSPATKLLGVRSFAFGFTQQIFAALFQSFILLFFLLLCYIILRRERIAAFVLWVIAATALSLTQETAASVPFSCLAAAMVVWLLYRYGLLALIVALYFVHLLIFFPITSDFSAWYAGDFVLTLLIALALTTFGFYTSLAGEPLFRGGRLDD
jgi:hypothetical protein